MADADWEHESAYARYVLRGPSWEDELDYYDRHRKRVKEDEHYAEWWRKQHEDPED